VPDVLVFLPDTKAEDCGSHWLGGPDFAVEIVSPGDRTLEKLDFYAKIGTRELLVVDRDPWQLTLYRATDASKLLPIAISSLTQTAVVKSEIVPLGFSLDSDASCIHVFGDDAETIRDIAIRIR
jgi:Uma2 family endonuclease